MQTLKLSEWVKYRDILSSLSQQAANEFRDAVFNVNGYFGGVGLGSIPRNDLIDYAYALVSKYGEGTSAVACAYYDALAALSGAEVPEAIPAATATYEETAKAINGCLKQSTTGQLLESTVYRLVKQAGADTTLQNAERDGAQFAWIPAGQTCAFCLTLASRGWQNISKKTLRNGHAEHIHANCDCAYTVRFSSDFEVEGYDPEQYAEFYYDADGAKPKDKINSMRREMYQDQKIDINKQKREAYAKRKEMENQQSE